MTFTLTMPDCGEAGAIIARAGSARVEFRGPPYSRWTVAPETTESAFYRLHAALEGWHTSPLHAGGDVAIHSGHPDYPAVLAMWTEATA